MSVINQVLNQLEQRGAHGAPEQTMVRAVPSIKRKSAMPLLMLGLALAIGVAVWQWIQPRKPDVVAMSVAPYQPTVIAAVAPASAVPPPAVSDAIEEPQVVEMLLPASRLSFELSSIPLPSSLRESKNSVAPGKVEGLAANSASADHRQDSAKVTPAAGAPAKPNRKSGIPPPAPVASTDEKAAVQPSGDTLPLKQISPAQHADAEFRKAVALMQQGRIADALAGYEAALRLDAGHDAARQALGALLLAGQRGAEAERVLQDGLGVKPGHTGFAMLLARLQVERGAVELATATLEKTLIQAERQADYHAFFAALLQRQNRQEEAIVHYRIALQLVPDNGIWLMGYGISLQAVQRTDEARDAYSRALESQTLSPELRAFVQMKLKEL